MADESVLRASSTADPRLLERSDLESLIAADVRALNAESDRIGRTFAGLQRVSNNDMDALLQIVVSEAAGAPLSPGELAERLGVSGPAITYLVNRLIDSGHVRRETHQSDRRRLVLRYSEHGLGVARSFFDPLREHIRAAMSDVSDADLVTAHRVLSALSQAIGTYRKELDERSN